MEQLKRDDSGRFLPGNTPGGRPKGAKNKATKEVRDRFQQLVDSYSLEQMKLDLMELEPGERLRIVTGMLDFFIPKLNRTDHTMSNDNDTITILVPGDESIQPFGDLSSDNRGDDNVEDIVEMQPDLFTGRQKGENG